MKIDTLPIETLHRLLSFNPDTGVLVWKKRPLDLCANLRLCNSWNAIWAGKPALTSVDHNGYPMGHVLGRKCPAHRVLWALVHGEWPDQIDHINGIKTDNRLLNLRSVTKLENFKNRRLSKNNRSGTMGVSLRLETGQWRASIRDENSRQISLGHFAVKDDAIAARKAAELQYGYHENHGSKIS